MIQRFLDYIAIERKYSPRTVEAYGDDLREFCAFLGVDEKSFDPTLPGEDDVKTWVFDLAEEKHNAPRSVHQKLSALHSFYRYLLREGIVTKDITRRVQLPKVDKPLPKFFKPQERADMPLSQCNNITIKNINMACDNFFDVGTSDKYALKDFSFENIHITDKKNAFDPAMIEGTKVAKMVVNGVAVPNKK